MTTYETDFPAGYFQRTITRIQNYLQHPVRVRRTLSGYVKRELLLTEGSSEWVDFHHRSHGDSWLFKADEFHFDLVPLPQLDVATPAGKRAVPGERLGLSPEEVIARGKPAVVVLLAPTFSGSGFFLNDSGLIVTNPHLAVAALNLTVIPSNGQPLEAHLVYVDPGIDIAFLALHAPSTGFSFLKLLLADPTPFFKGILSLPLAAPVRVCLSLSPRVSSAPSENFHPPRIKCGSKPTRL